MNFINSLIILISIISFSIAWIPCDFEEECAHLNTPCKVWSCEYRCYSADGSCTGKRDVEDIDSLNNGTIDKRYICGCCQAYNLPNGDTSCDNGVYCDGVDYCNGNGGVVKGTPPCISGSQCNNYCNEITHTCYSPTTTFCNDGLFCTQNDRCDGAGSCRGTGNPCSANGQCNNMCNEAADNCISPANTPCLADSFECTLDVCDSLGNCVHLLRDGQTCSDNNGCTVNDRCNGTNCIGTWDFGTCQCQNSGDCNDDNPCTLDICQGGSCIHTNNDNQACDDGINCNGQDMCLGGSCSSHFNMPCNRSECCNEQSNTCDALPGCVPDFTTGDITSGYVTSSSITTARITTSAITTGITSASLTSGEIPITSGTDLPSITTEASTTGFLQENQISSGLGNRTTVIIVAAIVAPIVAATFLAIVIAFLLLRKKKSLNQLEEVPLKDKPEIQVLKNIRISNKLGEGNYAIVYAGFWNDTPVALKKLKENANFEEFEKEATILYELGRVPHIVGCYGKFTSEEGDNYIVTEYMSKGNLLNLLRNSQGEFSFSELMEMVIDTCKGMVFLSERNMVHRDLSARNLLVTKSDDRLTVKISDFGLARAVGDKDHYTMTSGSPIPIRWSAVEVLREGKFSSKSDVWSFGVTVWEIFTFGAHPFTGLSNKEVGEQVLAGLRLSKPDNCPENVWECISKCFETDPAVRPSFSDLVKQLQNLRQDQKSKTIEHVDEVVNRSEYYNITPANKENYTVTSTHYELRTGE